MAMDKDRLGDAIVAALKVLNPHITGAQETELKVYWKAISNEILNEITTNMQITTDVTVPGVQTGTSTVAGTGVENTIS